MFSIKRPTNLEIEDYIRRQIEQPFSYDFMGCTREQPLAARPGWNIDHHRVLLGHGSEAFVRARAAIDAWQMFPPEMTSVFGHEVPREGLVVAVLYRVSLVPVWLLMPARVVYTIHDTIRRDGHTFERYGFAYGTLPEHPERGEERFLVEWNHTDDTVHYDLLAVSQPRHLLARLAFPFARHEQARFRRLSGLAMQRAVGRVQGSADRELEVGSGG
jgi:uncharacterized protein (UPF0548 family)